MVWMANDKKLMDKTGAKTTSLQWMGPDWRGLNQSKFDQELIIFYTFSSLLLLDSPMLAGMIGSVLGFNRLSSVMGAIRFSLSCIPYPRLYK